MLRNSTLHDEHNAKDCIQQPRVVHSWMGHVAKPTCVQEQRLLSNDTFEICSSYVKCYLKRTVGGLTDKTLWITCDEQRRRQLYLSKIGFYHVAKFNFA